jgi:hypothetical protein
MTIRRATAPARGGRPPADHDTAAAPPAALVAPAALVVPAALAAPTGPVARRRPARDAGV